MDGRQFDRLTRLLSAGFARRNAVKALAGVMAGGVATQAVVHNALACLEDGQFCTDDHECCGVCVSFNCQDCVPKGNHGCVDDNDCCGGKQECVHGVCKKRKKKVKCDGKRCKRKRK